MYDIRKATEQEIEQIRNNSSLSSVGYVRRRKTRKRPYPIKAKQLEIYVGKSSFRFKGEPARHVKVWGTSYNGREIRVWTSYEGC